MLSERTFKISITSLYNMANYFSQFQIIFSSPPTIWFQGQCLIFCVVKSSPCFWYQFLYHGSNFCIFPICFSSNTQQILLIYHSKHLFLAFVTFWQLQLCSMSPHILRGMWKGHPLYLLSALQLCNIHSFYIYCGRGKGQQGFPK